VASKKTGGFENTSRAGNINSKDTLPGELCTRPTMGIIAMPFEEQSLLIGIVKDEENNPVPNASITIKGSGTGVAANEIGSFSLKTSIHQPIIILVTAIGYEPVEINLKKERLRNPITIYLKRQEIVKTQEVVVVATGLVKGKLIMGGVTKGMKINSESEVEERKRHNPLTIFPNPTHSRSSVRIEWKRQQPGEFLLQFLSLSGQVIFTQDLRMDKKSRLPDLLIPDVSAGTYFIRITNKKTKENFTEKLIVH